MTGRPSLVTMLALLVGGPAMAQAQAPPQPAKAPESLVLHFGSGSAAIRAEDAQVLDQASRTYSDGKPLVMIVSGASDTTGSAAANLLLSQQRANNVVKGLVDRGIPVERFQVVAKGETSPAVATPHGVAEAANRQVEITWR